MWMKEEQNYDDVQSLKSQDTQLIYDDVDCGGVITTTNILPPSLRPQPQPQPQELNVAPQVAPTACDDIYEAEPSISPVASPMRDAPSLPATPIPATTPVAQPTKPVIIAPLKTEKTFALPLPDEKMQMPYGLDKWLEDMVIANRARLKRLDNNVGAGSPQQFVPPPRAPVQPIPVEGKKTNHSLIFIAPIYVFYCVKI